MNVAESRLLWGSLGFLVISLLTGCAAERNLAIIRNDLDRMNRQLLQLQVAQEISQTKPGELVQRELEGERRSIADLRAGVDELRQQVGILNERLEESGSQLRQRVSALEARVSPGTAQAPATSAALPPPGATAGAPPPAAAPGQPTPTPPPIDTSPAAAEAKGVYQAALGDYQRGRFDLAVQGFRTYLEQAPRGDVADTAQYYLAESLYSARDYGNAIEEFERLVREYSQSPQVPSALLKTGYAYFEVKDGVQGRRALRALIEKYPFSREAKLAEERLRLEDRASR